MNVLKIKEKLKKILLILMLIFTLNSCMPVKTKAADDGLGGKLLNPVMSLFVSLGDGVMSILHEVTYNLKDPLIEIGPESFLMKVLKWVSIIAIIVVAVVLIIATIITAIPTGGASIVAVGAALAGTGSTIFWVSVVAAGGVALTAMAANATEEALFGERWVLSSFVISPETILDGSIPLFDVNFFNPQEEVVKEGEDGEDVVIMSTALKLRKVISSWYVILRNIAIVLLLCVLVYIGIRIIISSTGQEKAKYKQRIIDWIVAMCLLFFMQYIMSFSVSFVEKIIAVLNTARYQTIKAEELLPEHENESFLSGFGSVSDELLKKSFGEEGATKWKEDQTKLSEEQKKKMKDGDIKFPYGFTTEDEDNVENAYRVLVEDPYDEETDSPFYCYFGMDGGDPVTFNYPCFTFMDSVRMKLQMLDIDDDGDGHETYTQIGYKLIYVVMVIYTVVFFFMYLKRVIYMAFLTLISPLVAFTYPIDKINDGQAQGFNKWFKEYIFNLLLQPMQLLLYTILVSSAMTFADQNIIYVIVILTFISKGEKILRSFFGFEKASTPGGLAGSMAGVAMATSAFSKLITKPIKGNLGKGNSDNSKSNSNGSNDDDGNVNYYDKYNNNDLFGGSGNDDNQNDNDNDNSTDTPPRLDDSSPDSNTQDQGTNVDGAQDDGTMLGSPRVNPNMMENGEGDETSDGEGTGNSNDPTSAPIRQPVNQSMAGGQPRTVNTGTATKRPLKNTPKNGKHRRFKGALGTAKYLGKTVGKPLAKKAGKMGLGLATGTLAGTAMMLGGIVKGDNLEDVIRSTATGFATGAVAGSRSFDGIVEDVKGIKNSAGNFGKGARDAYRKEALSKDEYKEAKIQDNIRTYQKDRAFKKELRHELGDKDGSKTKEVMENIVPECIRYGISDVKEIDAISKMVDDGIDINQAIGTAQFVKSYGKDTNNLSAKDDGELNKTLLNNAGRNENVKTVEQQENIATKVRDDMNRYSAYMYGTKKMSTQKIKVEQPKKEAKKPSEEKKNSDEKKTERKNKYEEAKKRRTRKKEKDNTETSDT